MSDTVKCEDCGQEFQSARTNAKYCRVCRLLKNAVYIAGKTYECWACGNKFAPLERNDKFCGTCNTVRSVHDAEGSCVFCKTKTPKLLHQDVRVCRGCATDPEQRPLLVRALKKKRDARAAA